MVLLQDTWSKSASVALAYRHLLLSRKGLCPTHELSDVAA
jgi:hypothetical protein